MLVTLDRPLASFLPAQLTLDGSSLTIVPSSGTAIPLGVAIEQCPHCSEDSYRVAAPLLSWQDAEETVWRFVCCEQWCSGCRSVTDPDREFFCWHCEQCGSCCECTRCAWCAEVSHIVCGDCNYCDDCTARRCQCEPEYDDYHDCYDDDRTDCAYDRFVTVEGFTAQYGRHTDTALFAAECIARNIPEERGMGYVACWIAPDGAVLACSAHYNFASGSYDRPFAAGYVRITAQQGSYGCQVGERRPTDAQLDTLTALHPLFCTPTRSMFFDSRYTVREGGPVSGRIDSANMVRPTLLNTAPEPVPTYSELAAAGAVRTLSYVGLYRNGRTPARRDNGD